MAWVAYRRSAGVQEWGRSHLPPSSTFLVARTITFARTARRKSFNTAMLLTFHGGNDLNNRYMRGGSSQTNLLSVSECSFPRWLLLGKIENARSLSDFLRIGRILVQNARARGYTAWNNTRALWGFLKALTKEATSDETRTM
ncbi:hypothetical protein EAG_04828 [Camponotus floridanus]|uniref:Uncharacterized protein n=1 Tax=Camponotus floridanus TaxID=104421 RepID=E2AGV3_CAMFO|nr:hypothetical protein EAG_04828 [Camponotus floridanus]